MPETELVSLLNDSFRRILPEIVLVAVACAVFLGGTLRRDRHLWAFVTLLGLGAAAGVMPLTLSAESLGDKIYASPLVYDKLFWYLRIVALASGAIFVLFSWNEVGDRQAADYFGCMLIVLAGLSLTGAANDLITLFLALELISIPTYIMLYLPKHDDESQEAALKYFMLSVFSSALLLFGFSYLYGLTGSTNLSVLIYTLNSLGNTAPPLLSQIAVIMVLAGLGFKITAVPFHFYAPDVYQGTSTVMAAILAFVPKAAGFIAILRIFGFILPETITTPQMRLGEMLSLQLPILLSFLAVVTMFLGNLLALLQNNLRRLFAYSSVAHAGYMLIGLAAAPYLNESYQAGNAAGPNGVAAVLYYLIAYGAMTVGGFAVIAYLHSPSRPVETVDDLAGLSKTHPWAAVLMTVFLFSLIGMPFTAGFMGKFLIFFGAVGVQAGQPTLMRTLAVLGVINAAIGAWYYLRIIAAMYLRTAIKPVDRRPTAAGLLAIMLCAVLTVGLSIPPGVNWLVRATRHVADQPGSGASEPVARSGIR